MRKLVLGLLLAGSSVFCVSAPAATMYVSDQFTVPLRRGPSNTSQDHATPACRAAPRSKCSAKIPPRDSRRCARRTAPRAGCRRSIFPTSRSRATALAAADRRVESLEAQLKTLRDTYQETRGARTQSEGRATDLAKQTEKLQTELAEVRRISATSIANYEENKQLKASNESLQTQVTQLTERVRQLERNVMLRWMLAGGALVLLGLILGAWIKSRPKRSSWA